MLCITYCQQLFKQRGRDAVLNPPVITIKRDEPAYGKKKRTGTTSHLPIESNSPYKVVSTAEAAQQQQFFNSIENANVHKAHCIVDNTESNNNKKTSLHICFYLFKLQQYQIKCSEDSVHF